MVSISDALQTEIALRLARRLAPRRSSAADLRAAGQTTRLRQASARRATAEARARLAPFTAETTVHQAWARHPGVAAIFGRYALHACPSCSVGVDETLKEAAFGYDIPLDHLLKELNRLLEGW